MDSYNMMYSSGDESDTDMLVHSFGDYDLPLSKENHHHVGTTEAAVNLTLHRFGDIQRGHRKRRRKFLVPLPPPHGIAFLGKYYLVMTTLCFAAMGNGLNLTDGLDGLVGGVSSLAFIGMSIAVLPICPGGALTAMAACTGMFIPLFISSGVFVFEVLSVILQVLLVKAAPQLVRRALPLHYHLKLWGYKTRVIVASAYVLSGILALFAGYVGLISA